MAFNINEFRTNISKDGFRPNLFEISMTFPTFAQPGNASKQLTFLARATSLPASTIGIAPLYYFGRMAKFAGNREFGNWAIQVIMDEDFNLRHAFERWSNALSMHLGNIRASAALAPASYVSDAIVKAYSKIGGIIEEYKIISAFPVDIGEVALNWEDNNRIGEFPVVLAYQWWENTKSTS